MEDEEFPYFRLQEIFEIFGYKTLQSAYVAISRGCLPVATYKLAGRRVADREVVRAFFKGHRQLGGEVLRERFARSMR